MSRALSPTSVLDPRSIQGQFPILNEVRNGKQIVYLDSAASAQRPTEVLDAMRSYYSHHHANVHRGVYSLADEATQAYEGARQKVASFIGARPSEIVFSKNATEAANLVAHTWGRQNLSRGDKVVVSLAEHHANFVPWLMLKEHTGIELAILNLTDDYRLDPQRLKTIVEGAKAVVFTAASNVTGALSPVKELAAIARDAGAVSVVDASQWAPHRRINVTDWNADFVFFTGHKLMGPTGIGVLWARDDLLESIPPFLGGGEMITDVRIDGFTCNEIPWKFEAGTPPIAEAIGLGAAIDFLEAVGIEALEAHEQALTEYMLNALQTTHGDTLTIIGPTEPRDRLGVVSFTHSLAHPHDVAQILDERAVCVRAGHHCAKPLHRELGLNATTRASVYLYNTTSDIDALVDALHDVNKLFG